MTDAHPACIAFDMVETTFSLEKLRPLLVAADLEGHRLESWFSGMLRDAFALDTIGQFVAFPDLARASLRALGLDDDQADIVISGFADLDAHPDAEPAMRRLRENDIRVIALTNGSEGVTRTILDRNGLMDHVERIISITDIGRWKPAVEVYNHAADAMGLSPRDMGLFAAHPWDCAGAAHAGFFTGYVQREGPGWPDVIARPDVSGDTLIAIADATLVRRDL